MCGSLETMDHIMLQCKASGQETIWSLAKELWLRKGLPWPTLSIGSILSCGIADFRTNQNSKHEGMNCLFTVVMSESLYLIWKLRCKWKIQKDSNPQALHSRTEITNRWLHAINLRLRFDCLLTNRKRYGPKAHSVAVVCRTWAHAPQ